MTKKDQYYVIGNPVKQSLSPLIHRFFAKETHQSLNYDYLELERAEFKPTIALLKNQHHIKGLSITSPYKEEAYKLCDYSDEYAKSAQAVSNISFDANRNLYGHNLDGYAFIDDLRMKNISLESKNILIIGAGGATKGLLLKIINNQPKSIYILNRNQNKIEKIINNFKKKYKIKSFNNRAFDVEFDIIINATSPSIKNQFLNENLNFVMTKKTIGYDLSYFKNDNTSFVNWMKNNNLKVHDGTGMILSLSREIFTIWRGVRPKLNPFENHNISL